MIAPRFAAAVAAFALGFAGCGHGDAPRRTIALGECRLPKVPLTAQCGTLEVPENRAKPEGRRISLAIAVLPANTLNPRPDPLFILAGGPGQAASFLGPFAALLTGVRKDRDIVLVDQRGTGRSSPLECTAFKLDDNAGTALDIDQVPKAAACAKELAAAGVDAAQYTTAAWIADLDAVRNALGYAKINLWGGSYGTRAALEYLRAYPARVRSIVLDGVAPPSMKVAIDVWPTRERALTAVLDACARSAPCRAEHPALQATLDGIREGLGPNGRDVTVTDPRTGAIETQHVTFDHVLAALEPLTYAPELSALLPEVIGSLSAGDYGPLFAGAMLVSGDLSEQLNSALHYSVTCTEDAPRITSEELAAALASVRSPSLAQQELAVCAVWPRGEPSADAAKPVVSDVPVLILSGELDPVTPPANGAEVARTLPASRHIVAHGYGHIVSPHACAPRLIAAFIDDPTFASLPASCVAHFEKSARPPLWPDRLGARS
ncbi:MAG TPA: alpha/beta hydrolase [Casimicrobiaceae bacterium]|nr:alpha/beta hydrolase [Casimicrobiaceae bacterium]